MFIFSSGHEDFESYLLEVFILTASFAIAGSDESTKKKIGLFALKKPNFPAGGKINLSQNINVNWFQ